MNRVLKRFGHMFSSPLRVLMPSVGRVRIDRISIAPQDLRTTDPTIAADIYAGYFSFAGKVVATGGGSPFDIIPPSREWAEALMGFGWLRDVRSAETALARTNARTLVDDWITVSGSPRRSIAWEAPVIARRIISWIDHAPIILDGADRSFHRRFTGSIARQCIKLGRLMRDPALMRHRLIGAVALAYVAVCSERGSGRFLKRVSLMLSRELKRHVLADGGTISRNPQDIIELLADLLPLRYAYEARSFAVPVELLNGIDRMMPMLRFFRHGDGALALFNGMSATAPDMIATLLAYQDTRTTTSTNAPVSGYRRLQGGETVAIIDVGKPPPEIFSDAAHAGCLSFELSCGPQRIVINCGAPLLLHDQQRLLARTTAAHSTMILNDTSSCQFAAVNSANLLTGGAIINGPKNVVVKREEDEISDHVVATHDGYRSQFGVEHTRSLKLSKSGDWLSGEDYFGLVKPRRAARVADSFVLRFHLNPQIEVDISADQTAIYLGGIDAGVWTFSADGLPLAIDESVFFAGLQGSCRTRQIVVRGNFRQTPLVRWHFVREGGITDDQADDGGKV